MSWETCGSMCGDGMLYVIFFNFILAILWYFFCLLVWTYYFDTLEKKYTQFLTHYNSIY